MLRKSPLGWSPNLDVGNEKLNDEHKTILDRMGRLEELNGRSMSKEVLLGAFDELVQYAEEHFREEEEYMREIGYPQADTHARIHESLLEALQRYRAELVASVYGRFPSSVFDFFRTWMMTHIMIVDKQYSDFAKGRVVQLS